MKKMKKAFALLIAAVLVLSLGATAFAAGDTGSITLKDAANVSVAGKTFNAYKILDASFVDASNPESGVAYTVPAELADFYAKRYTLDKTAPNFGELVAAAIVERESGDMFAFAADALAAAKAAGVKPGSATAEADVHSVTIGNLPFGYYVVEDAGAKTPISALMLQTVGGVNIQIKADKPTIDKVIVNADSANGGKGNGTAQDVGSVVEFELTSKVPDMTGYKSYTYVVHDTMSDGLSFNKESVKVTIGGEEYTDFTVAEAGQSFTITFNNFIAQQVNKGKDIVITYSAALNEKALKTDVETNTVKLEYSNNPNYVPGGEHDDGGTEETPENKVYVYDFDIVIDKYTMQAEENVKLADAEFVLYKGEGEGKTYYKWNEDTKKVEWVKTIDEATKKTTDKNGYARFEGLDAGTYYLEETKAPAGYNKLAEPVEVVISASYNSDGTIASSSTELDSSGQLSQTQSIENHSGTVLPETGGIGTTIFYIVGAVLAVGAIILLITKKRMANETK